MELNWTSWPSLTTVFGQLAKAQGGPVPAQLGCLQMSVGQQKRWLVIMLLDMTVWKCLAACKGWSKAPRPERSWSESCTVNINQTGLLAAYRGRAANKPNDHMSFCFVELFAAGWAVTRGLKPALPLNYHPANKLPCLLSLAPQSLRID